MVQGRHIGQGIGAATLGLLLAGCDPKTEIQETIPLVEDLGLPESNFDIPFAGSITSTPQVPTAAAPPAISTEQLDNVITQPIPYESYKYYPFSAEDLVVINLMDNVGFRSGVFAFELADGINARVMEDSKTGLVWMKLRVKRLHEVADPTTKALLRDAEMIEIVTGDEVFDITFVIGYKNPRYDGLHKGHYQFGCTNGEEAAIFLEHHYRASRSLYVSIGYDELLNSSTSKPFLATFPSPDAKLFEGAIQCQPPVPLATRLQEYHELYQSAGRVEKSKLVKMLEPRDFQAIAAFAYESGMNEIADHFWYLHSMWEEAQRIAAQNMEHRKRSTQGSYNGKSLNSVALKIFRQIVGFRYAS